MRSIQSYLIEGYLRLDRKFTPPARGKLDVARERLDTEAMAKTFGRFKGVTCTPVMVMDIPSEWIIPESLDTQRCALCLHGGSFFAGSINSHRSLAANIATAAKARALLIDYRLAPEHPYPAGLEDSITAYQWLLDTGTPPDRITIVGDSAGGALALGLVLSLREAGKPLPGSVVFLSPAFDLTFSSDTWKTNAKSDVMIELWKEKIAVDFYLRETDPRDPMASPLFADPRGLSPMLIQIGSAEVLLADSTSFAEKARTAGVDLTLEVWEGMQHEWQFAVGILPEARRAVARIGEFIQQHT